MYKKEKIQKVKNPIMPKCKNIKKRERLKK